MKRAPGHSASIRRVAATVCERSPPPSCSMTTGPAAPALPVIAVRTIASTPGRRQSWVSRSASTIR
jgi:hypothetical protein